MIFDDLLWFLDILWYFWIQLEKKESSGIPSMLWFGKFGSFTLWNILDLARRIVACCCWVNDMGSSLAMLQNDLSWFLVRLAKWDNAAFWVHQALQHEVLACCVGRDPEESSNIPWFSQSHFSRLSIASLEKTEQTSGQKSDAVSAMQRI